MVETLPLLLTLLAPGEPPADTEVQQRWQASEVVVVVEHGEGAPPDALHAAEQAAAAWNAVGIGPHLLVLGDDEPLADPLAVDEVNRIGVMREPWPYPSQAGAATIAWASTSTDVIFEADLALNADFEFGDANLGAYDLQSVLAHELGHLLGLDHLDDRPEATMYPLIPSGETKKRDLSEDDIAALTARYAGVALADPEPPLEPEPTIEQPPVQHEDRQTVPSRGCAQGRTPGAEGALALALAVLAQRRRARRTAAVSAR
ncbi:MAG: matrixin family metalloprotease [Deltaproteobacteria bacterium]|nr:matrixin family metalloprotease [Deltaproteobacteria bacterium]